MVCLMSEEEMRFVDRYLEKYKITNKSRWFRETVLTFIHRKLQEDYPTLFAEHDMMFRSDFQELFGMTRTTANRHLRRLVEGGKLVNIGQRFHPVYVLGKSKVEK